MRWRRGHLSQLFVVAVIALSFVTIMSLMGPAGSAREFAPLVTERLAHPSVTDASSAPSATFSVTHTAMVDGAQCLRAWAFPDVVLPNDKGKRQQRGSSSPLVTGDGFRGLCTRDQLVLDDTVPVSVLLDQLRQHKPRNGSVFFVQTHFVETFIEKVVPSSAGSFVLVTHNSDYSAPYEPGNTRLKYGVAGEYERQRRLLLNNPQLLRWYAQNPSITHDKLFPLPIGIENRYNKYGQFPEVYLRHLCQASMKPVKHSQRNPLIFVAFSLKTNKAERSKALVAAEKLGKGLVTFGTMPRKGTAESAKGTLEQYLGKMGQHKFALTPHGHGLDTHRLWEALYAGVIPVVRRSHMDQRLLEHLPVLLVDDYSDISRDLLESFDVSESRWREARRTALNMSWWATQICLKD